MRRSDALGRIVRTGRRYAPRVAAGAIGLFSLLLCHQLIWSAFAELNDRLTSPRVWITTSLDGDTGLAARLSGERQAPRVSASREIAVTVVTPPDAIVEITRNGEPQFFPSERPDLHRRDMLQLAPGRNIIVAGMTRFTPAPEFGDAFVEVDYHPPNPRPPVLLAWRTLGGNISLIGLGEPMSGVELRSGTDVTWPSRALADEDGLFDFVGFGRPAGTLGGVNISSIAPDGRRVPGPTVTIPLAGADDERYHLVDGVDFRRVVSMSVGRESLSIHAEITLPSATELAERGSRFGVAGNFLRQMVGICIQGLPVERMRPRDAMDCARPVFVVARPDARMRKSGDTLIFDHEVRRGNEPLAVRWGGAGWAGMFLTMPGDELRLSVDEAAAPLVQVRGSDSAQADKVFVWSAGQSLFDRLPDDSILATVGAASTRAEAAPVPDTPVPAELATLLSRIRALEALVPAKVSQVLGTLLTAIPLLYVLWILSRFQLGRQPHAATIRAVTLTFLILHLSILAVSFFSATLSFSTTQQLGAVLPGQRWASASSLLSRATNIYPFLAIGVVMLVSPLFRSLRRAAVKPPNWPSRLGRSIGWVAFWTAVVGLPVVLVWILSVVQSDSPTPAQVVPIILAVGIGFATLWFVFFWLFRGVLRIGVSITRAMQAAWAMLLLPVVPLAADGGNTVGRTLVAVGWHAYPFMLPDRAGSFIAAAIVTILVALLLRQTGELAVRLSQHADTFRWWRTNRRIIFLVLIVAGIPVAAGSTAGDVFGVTEALDRIDRILPYALLIAVPLLVRLYNPADHFALPAPVVHVGALLFAWYGARGGTLLLFVPVPFLMAWFLFRKWLITPARPTVPTTPKVLRAFLEDTRARTRLDNLRKGLDKKFSEGEIKLADYSERLKEGEKSSKKATAALADATGGAEARVFGNGPEGSPWENARIAILYGMLISAPFQALTLARMVGGGWGGGRFPLIELTYAVLYSTITWLVMAGVFGYFFHVIRGRNGFEKALSFSLCVFLPAIPVRLVVGASLLDRAQVLDIVQVVAFTLVLALTAFDLRTLQKQRYGWRDLMTVYGLASAAYGSTIVIAVVSTFGGRDLIAGVWSFLKTLAQ